MSCTHNSGEDGFCLCELSASDVASAKLAALTAERDELRKVAQIADAFRSAVLKYVPQKIFNEMPEQFKDEILVLANELEKASRAALLAKGEG